MPRWPNLRDLVELKTLQRDNKRAEKDEAQGLVDSARRERDRVDQLVQRNAVGTGELDKAKDKVREAENQIAQFDREIAVAELGLDQAKRRVEAEMVRVRREAERAKTRLDWAEKMHAKGYLSTAEFDAARDRYDDLVFQLDPNHKPTPAAVPPVELRPISPDDRPVGQDGRPIGAKPVESR